MVDVCGRGRCRVMLLPKLSPDDVECRCQLTDVAKLNGKIYVIAEGSNKMNIFGRHPSFNTLKDIVIK